MGCTSWRRKLSFGRFSHHASVAGLNYWIYNTVFYFRVAGGQRGWSADIIELDGVPTLSTNRTFCFRGNRFRYALGGGLH